MQWILEHEHSRWQENDEKYRIMKKILIEIVDFSKKTLLMSF